MKPVKCPSHHRHCKITSMFHYVLLCSSMLYYVLLCSSELCSVLIASAPLVVYVVGWWARVRHSRTGCLHSLPLTHAHLSNTHDRRYRPQRSTVQPRSGGLPEGLGRAYDVLLSPPRHCTALHCNVLCCRQREAHALSTTTTTPRVLLCDSRSVRHRAVRCVSFLAWSYSGGVSLCFAALCIVNGVSGGSGGRDSDNTDNTRARGALHTITLATHVKSSMRFVM